MSSSRWKRRALLAIAPPAARSYLALTAVTTRLQEVGIPEESLRERHPPPYVAVFWHRQLFHVACRFHGPEYAALISTHTDGEVIARCVGALGTRCVRGSTKHEWGIAMRRTLGLLEQGVTCAVTPDGPLGPRSVAKPGAVILASLAGVPIVPLALATRRKLVFRSWDSFQVPLPFSRGAIALGEPLIVPGELDDVGLERYRSELEQRLNQVTERADRCVGD